MLPDSHHSDVDVFFFIFPLKQDYFSNNMQTKVKRTAHSKYASDSGF